MGTFRVRFMVSSLPAPDAAVEVTGLVDTGATFPFIPEQVLQSLGIQPSGKKSSYWLTALVSHCRSAKPD